MWVWTALLSLLAFAQLAPASPYREDLTDYNINTNKNAQSPTDYTTNKRSSYTASPPNWRAVPFYTILMDKFADGDPSNNDWFGTMYEWDWRETQLRFGGDLKGLVSKLDYLQGMGIKGVFVSGTPFINMLWQADSQSYSLSVTCLASCSAIVRQAIPHSTSPCLTHTGAPWQTGNPPSTRSTLAECTLWRTSPLVQWPTLSASRGMSSAPFHRRIHPYSSQLLERVYAVLPQ